MNIILDRFPSHHVTNFSEIISRDGFKVVLSTLVGNSGSDDVSDQKDLALFGDFDISSGLFFAGTPWILTRQEMVALSEFEGLFIKLLSRFSLVVSNWSASEMSDHFFKLCNFWKFQISSQNVEAVFSFFEPHDPSSFSLYVVTKQLRVPYLFLDLPIIAGKIRFISVSFSERNLLVREDFPNPSSELNVILNDYLNTIRTDFDKSMLPTMRSFYEKHTGLKLSRIKKETFSKISNFFRRCVRLRSFGDFKILIGSVIQFFFPETPIFFKYDRKLWFNFEFKGNRLFWLICRIRNRRRIYSLKNSYFKNCSILSKKDLPEKYCIFAAPVEPEASNVPSALSGGSVELFIDQLLSELPVGAKLVYRVNPAQFKADYAPHSNGIDWHRPSFYSDLISKGVLFSTPEIQMDDLIVNSFAVASINGTIGIEAIALGKPVIISAPMWYDTAKGVHVLRNSSALREFLHLSYENAVQVDATPISISARSAFISADIGNCNDLDQNSIVYLAKKFVNSFRYLESNLLSSDRIWKV